MFFKRKIKLYSEEVAYEDDLLCFIDFDGEHHSDKLRYDKKLKRLIFRNNGFKPQDYLNLKKCDYKKV